MQTLFIGQSLFFVNELESTNSYASDLTKKVNVPEGAIVYTDNQTKGRGQRGTVWSTEIAQNITLSVILKPTFLSTLNHFYLSKITALALYDVLAEQLIDSQYDIKIKWPNDILVNKKKIAGILIENTVQQQGIQHSIIGIGLNVNQTQFDDFENAAISLKTLTNKNIDRIIILEKIAQHLEKWYLRLKSNSLDSIDKTYKERLFKLNETAEFIDTETQCIFTGKITNITTDGRLSITKKNNEIEHYELKQVKLIF